MIQSIYSSVSNAEVVQGKKGQSIKSEPIPLLKDKYLGEYRTELEKAKVRKNLGIPDEVNLDWKNMQGYIEDAPELIKYIETKQAFTTELNENITTIQEAIAYALEYVSNFKGEHEAVIELQDNVENIFELITGLQTSIGNNVADIDTLESAVIAINESITKLNEDLKTINVDENILNWVTNKVKDSTTVTLSDSIEVRISGQLNNAIQILEGVEGDPENGVEPVEEILPGLYVKDLTSDLKLLEDRQTEFNLSITDLNGSFDQLAESIDSISSYDTSTSDDTTVPTTVGGISAGTKAELLKGKSISYILDMMLFPTVVRDLIYPYASYSYISTLVEVGSPIIRPTLSFYRGDAGVEKTDERTDSLTFNGSEVEGTTYSEFGIYSYLGRISYEAGEYLIDNKGNVTNKRIEAGSVSASTNVTTTYPWFVNGSKQSLIQFGYQSSYIDLTLNGTPVIKIPGENSTYVFEIYGLGWGDVNMSGWNVTIEEDSKYGIKYQVLSKKPGDPYTQDTQFRIKLNLQL